MANPVSTTSLLAQARQTPAGLAARPERVSPVSQNNLQGGNAFSMMSSGLQGMANAFSAPEERAAAQANADRANAIRLEQLAYDRGQNALAQSNTDNQLAFNKLRNAQNQANTKIDQAYRQSAHDDEMALRRQQEKRLGAAADNQAADKEYAAKKRAAFDTAENDALAPLRESKANNRMLVSQMDQNPNISYTIDDKTGKVSVTGTKGHEDEAKAFQAKLQNSSVLGDADTYANQLRELQRKSLADGITGNDISNAEVTAQIQKYNQGISDINALNSNQNTELSGIHAGIDSQRAAQLADVVGDSPYVETAHQMDLIDKSRAEGGDTIDPLGEFLAATTEGMDRDDANNVRNETLDVIDKAKDEYEPSGEDKWLPEYEGLAIQRAMDSAKVGQEFFDWGDNDISNKVGLKDEIIKQMRLINQSRGTQEYMKTFNSETENLKTQAKLRYYLQQGLINK